MEAPILDYMQKSRFKALHLLNDTSSGLRAVIAIHSTALGPATGGLRMWTYDSEQDAIMDALRLARGMTYKYAAAGINLGGGKAVVIGDPATDKSEALFRAFGRMVDGLGGEYQTGEDVGTTLDDMELIYTETDHVVTLPEHCGGVGDIAPATALGSVQALLACAERAWGSTDIADRTVALQGLGAVGSNALPLLLEAGAEVVVTDVNEDRVRSLGDQYGVRSVAPDDIYDLDVDIFAPYALGGVINDDTIERLQVKVVAGSANNIFAKSEHAVELERRGIVYAVDYIANSGGTILDTDRLRKGGLQRERAMRNVRRIGDRIRHVFSIADQESITYSEAADRLAERRMEALTQVRLI